MSERPRTPLFRISATLLPFPLLSLDYGLTLTRFRSIGPRKLLRAITGASDLLTPTSLRDHALHERMDPQTPLAAIPDNSDQRLLDNDYFPDQGGHAGFSHEAQATEPRNVSAPISEKPKETPNVSARSREAVQIAPQVSPAVMTPSVLDEQQKHGGGQQPDTNATVLLVEDNNVNMKVSS